MSKSYHHGDLREALLCAAEKLVAEQGLDGLTLRKLAEQVGVSRTGAYHHFENKNALVCAVAERGFEQLETLIIECRQRANVDAEASLRRFVHDYVAFATERPELYALLFGHTIWKADAATASLKAVAYRIFSLYAQWIEELVLERDRSCTKRQCLSIAQAGWSGVHGLCRLSNDGVYLQSSDLSGAIGEVANSVVHATLKR